MENRPGNRWPLLFSAMLALLFASYHFYLNCTYPANGAIFIIAYGILCAAAVLFLALYALRKRSYSCRIGSRQSWLQAHVYTGIISIIMIFMHFRFKPAGTFSIFLSILFFLVIISGITGSLLYSYIPVSLSKYGRKVKSEEEIINKAAALIEEAKKLVSGSSRELEDIYERKIRPLMESARTRPGYLLMYERELINRRREMINDLKNNVPGQDVHDLDILGSILIEKEKLSFMRAKLVMQRIWLTLHLPLTLALLTATVFHIVAVIYY